MKRSALWFAALALAGASTAGAQGLTMQMTNGWMFSFSGNVNIFGMYQSQGDDGTVASPGALTGVGDQGFFFGTGLLPAFATFEAKGKEGDTDLAVHFGFAPQVQCGGRNHDCFGAQIDMRQVYLTAGGGWGQILAGKELALFNRQNILNDQTLFGVGATGIAPAGTTLGRIGFGYVYPNFVAQMTYSTPAGKPGQLSIGIFDPAAFGPYTELNTPRVETEATYKKDKFSLFVNGTLQNGKDPDEGNSKTATGIGGGLRYSGSNFSLHGSGYWGSGIGTTLQFNGVGSGSFFDVATDAAGNLRDSYGYFAQLTFTAGKATFAGSYGSSYLSSTDDEPSFKTENTLVSGGLYYQATKSLKIVGELNYQWSDNTDAILGLNPEKNTAFTGAFGLMLFF
jgi:hypothetical protein